MGALEVLILGGSVSGGGGVDNRVELAWPRMLGDVLPTVRHKNAVDPSYFLHCASRFVEHGYDVVLFDLAANMMHPGAAKNMVTLARRMRCFTNASAVGIVNWPGYAARYNAGSTRWAAQQARVALLEVPHESDLYASDGVHPNGRGHALIAERVRAFLDSVKPSRPNAPSAPDDCAAPLPEWCYPSAPEMPVMRNGTGKPHGWELVDDSPTPDRLHKYGWASSEHGTPLTMVVPPGSTCGTLVTVAYLASNVTGPFRLACEAGCACSPLQKSFQPAGDPFPIVTGHESWVKFANSHNITTNSTRNPNQLKVTKETTFHLLRERKEACRITATPTTDERVRIDALYVREADVAYTHATLHSPLSTPEQRWFALNALRRADCGNLSGRAETHSRG
jgi:hypothetical protein